MKRKQLLAEYLHHVSTIWLYLHLSDSDISLVQVVRSSRALDELREELARALNQTQ